jgi:CRP-like cAMP-binding protein
LREGEDSTHVLLLLQGFVKVTKNAGNGRITLLGIRVGGDLFGELAALEGTPRSATVTAGSSVTLRHILRSDFLAFLDRQPEANRALLQMMSIRLRWTADRQTDFGGYPAGIRLARILIELAKAYGHQTAQGITLDLSLTQHDLGTLAGAEVDTAGKELRTLRSQGVINTGYRRIVIHDLDALKAYAQLCD